MKYNLHYVGSKLYPKEIFIAEAEKCGVNRCLPLRIIKGLKWRDKILLATFNAKEIELTCDNCKKCGETTCGNDTENLSCFELGKVDGRKNKKDGTAQVFGYFTISGLNLTATEEFKRILTSQLDIVRSTNCNWKVQRQCGNYTLASSHIINNSIEEVIEKVEKLAKERQEKIKFFIAGEFYPLNITLNPINFSRTLIPIELEVALTGRFNNCPQGEVGFIFDYNKRAYIKKKDKQNASV